MKRLQITQKLMYEVAILKKSCVHKISSVTLSKNFFQKHATETCKPDNRDLNRD